MLESALTVDRKGTTGRVKDTGYTSRKKPTFFVF